ncbi:MAG: hypothetical protein H8E17_06450 [Deltaproteobacteria bacterium]|nr:hypothetical protein [Deltaproteobacteria bacterium]
MSSELITKIKFLAKAGLGENDEFVVETVLVDMLAAIESHEGEEVDSENQEASAIDESVFRLNGDFDDNVKPHVQNIRLLSGLIGSTEFLENGWRKDIAEDMSGALYRILDEAADVLNGFETKLNEAATAYRKKNKIYFDRKHLEESRESFRETRHYMIDTAINDMDQEGLFKAIEQIKEKLGESLSKPEEPDTSEAVGEEISD